VAAAAILLLLVAAVVWRAGGEAAKDPVVGPRPPSETRAEQAQASLTAVGEAWARRDSGSFVAAAGDLPDANVWALRTFDALRLLGVDDIRLRFVGERRTGATVSAPDAVQTFVGDVDVSWELDGYQTRTSTVSLRFADTGSGVSVLGLAEGAGSVIDPGSALPLWLAGELVGSNGRRCLGVDVDPDSVTCSSRSAVAERDVAAVLPAASRSQDWRIIVPASSSVASALLGRGAGGLGQIAAVTTTVDASGSPDAPQVVVLNPDVFARLRPAAAQLVLSHEAAHAATRAASVEFPLWVAEGFADYVALRSGRVPVERAAGQILAAVRRNGPPDRLPADAQFSSSRDRLAATYEAAWLVFRLLGERVGDARVVAFYEQVLDGGSVARALEQHTGLSVAQLTAQWRAELVALAG